MNNDKPLTSNALEADGRPEGLPGAGEAEDAAWLERATAGEAAAFEALFVKYRQRVFAVAWRLLHDEDAALDVVQEAFVKAYEQLTTVRGQRFYPWLRRIAINLAIDHVRRARRGAEVALDEQRVAGGEDQEEGEAVIVAKSGAETPLRQAEMTEFNAAFAVAVRKLSETHRTVFMLHASEGMSYKEIAEALGCNIGTVMSRLFYARKHLQEMLAPHLH